MTLSNSTCTAPLFDSKRSWDTVLSQNLHLCTIQSWTLNFEALAIRASNPQNVLNRISFHLPKSLPRPNHSLNYRDHAVAMAGQLAISPKTFLSCSSRTPLNHGQLWFFFSFFSSSTTFRTPENASIFWQGITSHFQTYQRNTH